jgi:uncharacterized membrane protein
MFDRLNDWLVAVQDRIRRGWLLTKRAFRVLRSEKQLLVFPLLSSLALVLVLATFAIPLTMSQIFRDLVSHETTTNRLVSHMMFYLLLFGCYFCNSFVIIFFNSAMVACVLMHFDGKKPTVGDGFQAAFNRLPQIFVWALVSATVGLIFKIIADRMGRLGRILNVILGSAWGVMTYFVVPVLVVEEVGPFKAIQKSWAVMQKNWGEGIVANFSTGAIMFLLYVVSTIPFFIGLFIGKWAILIGLVVTVVLWLLVSLVSSALNAIIIAVLYEYTVRQRVPRHFNQAMLRKAFGRS